MARSMPPAPPKIIGVCECVRVGLCLRVGLCVAGPGTTRIRRDSRLALLKLAIREGKCIGYGLGTSVIDNVQHTVSNRMPSRTELSSANVAGAIRNQPLLYSLTLFFAPFSSYP